MLMLFYTMHAVLCLAIQANAACDELSYHVMPHHSAYNAALYFVQPIDAKLQPYAVLRSALTVVWSMVCPAALRDYRRRYRLAVRSMILCCMRKHGPGLGWLWLCATGYALCAV